MARKDYDQGQFPNDWVRHESIVEYIQWISFKNTTNAFFLNKSISKCEPHNQTTYKHISPHLSLSHKISDLAKVLPILQSLPYISYGQKLWQYFREMGWFENGELFLRFNTGCCCSTVPQNKILCVFHIQASFGTWSSRYFSNPNLDINNHSDLGPFVRLSFQHTI